MKIVIGTRKSKLALWQAHWVAGRMEDAGIKTALRTMETRGDKILDVSISKIGSKGVFTEELEHKLETGSIDIAVHSAKDMQSRLPAGFEILSFSERAAVNDVIVSNKEIDLNSENLTLGTSSTRRVALLRHYYPNVKIVGMRGNLQTRISKLEKGVCDALVLAQAGVERSGYHSLIQVQLSEEKFVPAVGQGSIAVECHLSLDPDKKEKIRSVLNHEPTEKALIAERSYLAALDGGCSIPIFGLAKTEAGTVRLNGGIISLDGSEKVIRSGQGEDPKELGETLASRILRDGGEKILEGIREQLDKI